MRIVLERNLVAPPGDIRNMITGTERSGLLICKRPFWSEKVRMGSFVAEYDGLGNNASQYMQRNVQKSAALRFVDEGRFVGECALSDVTTLRLPLLISSIFCNDGRYYSVLPLAIAKDVQRVKMVDALNSAGFQPATSQFFQLPVHYVGNTDYTIADLFGNEFADLYPLVRSLSRHGPGEMLLQALQLDSEQQQLFGLSSQVPIRDVAAPDEVEVILNLIAAPSLASMFTTMNIINAMQTVRYASVINTGDDKDGVSLLFFYALQHSAYLTNIPADVYRALSAPDQAGVCTINAINGTTLNTPLRVQLPADLRQFGPMLGQVSDTMYASVMRARVAYKLLNVIRFLEAKGISPSPSYRFSASDREKLFKLVS